MTAGPLRSRERVFSALLATAILLLAASRVQADPNTVLAGSVWPMYGHDTKHTFRTSAVGPTVPNLLDPVVVPDKVTSQPTVSADGTFLVDMGFSVIGVRADGRRLWQSRLAADAKFSAPTADTNGFFYVGDRGNAFTKYNVDTGAQICRFIVKQDGDIRSSPTLSVKFPDRAYVAEAGVAGGLFAIGTQGSTACQVIWTIPPSQMPGGTANSISLADSTLGSGDSKGFLIHATSRSIYAVQDNGTSAVIKFSRNLGGLTQGSTPVIEPVTGRIFVGTWTRKFYALNPTDFSDVFPPKTLDSAIKTTAALSPDGSTVYVATERGGIYAFDTSTGANRPGFPITTTRNSFHITNAPSVDGNGNIYIGGSDHHVRGIHPNGTIFFDATVGLNVTAPVTIVDGGLLVGAWNKRFYRFCPDPTGPPTATKVCGFTVDTTAP
jgi:outer membrane protein assembly factor BamB